MNTLTEAPTCFVSYAWESDSHREWVRFLCNNLASNGIAVSLDAWDLGPGSDVAKYLESKLIECEFTIVVCTPEYAKKSITREGGVGFETSIISAATLQRLRPEGTIVPIVRRGRPSESIPPFLSSLVYVDFTETEYYSVSLETLLRHLHMKPAFPRPKIGATPNFGDVYLSMATRVVDALSIGLEDLDRIMKKKRSDQKRLKDALEPAGCMGSLTEAERGAVKLMAELESHIELLESVKGELEQHRFTNVKKRILK